MDKIATGGKAAAGFIAVKAKAAKEVVNDKIDSSDKLSNARDVAKERASQLGQAMSSGVN